MNDVTATIAAMPRRQYQRVVNALATEPWAIRPSMLDLMLSVVDDAAAGIPRDFTPKAEVKEGLTVVNGVAIVPVQGIIMNRANRFQQISGATSPQEIAAQYMRAMRMPDVSAVCLSIYSPGGQAIGTIECADVIWQEKQDNPRPTVAFIEGCGCSGAYWLASQCDQIIATRSSIIGSIGVVSKIVDETRSEKNAGQDSYVIRTGPNKAMGLGPITDDQLQIAREIQQQYFGMFTEAVQRGRGITLSEEVLTGREYVAEQALGTLVDSIGTMEDVLYSYGKNSKK